MRDIRLAYRDLMLDAERLVGQYLDGRHHDRVVSDDTRVSKPDGRLLLVYARDALPAALCRETLAVCRWLRPHSGQRGIAAGGGEASSAVLGFLDRGPRAQFCRMTTFTVDHYAEYEALLPFVAAISEKYREMAPEHWAAQHRFVDRVPEDFKIPQTVFTSVTVNRDFRTAAHTDRGNRRPGLEAIAVLGQFGGGELVFPRYRTAVDVRPRGLLLADMHEVHGNGRLVGERLSLVCYARAGMAACGTAEEEWQRAAR